MASVQRYTAAQIEALSW